MNKLISQVRMSARIQVNEKGMPIKTKHRHILNYTCRDENGNLIWVDKILNMVVKEGLDEILNKFYGAENYTATLFVGPTGSTPVFDEDDTMSSHAGWTEVENYDNITTRSPLIMGTASGQSIDNAENWCVFKMDSDDVVIGGSFICTSGVRGGTSGILIAGGAFSDGDHTLKKNYVLSAEVVATNASG